MIDLGYDIQLHPLDSSYLELLRKWRNDERIRSWTRQWGLITDADQARWFERQSQDPSIRMYLIKYDDEPIGVTGLTSIDLINRRAELSIYIAPEEQGNGYGKDAFKTIISHGFRHLGLHCIWAEIFHKNPVLHILSGLGFVMEGTRRDFYFRDGVFIDAHLMSIMASEWRY